MSIFRKRYVLLSTLVGALLGTWLSTRLAILYIRFLKKMSTWEFMQDKFSFHLIWVIVRNTWSLHDLPDALVYIFFGFIRLFFRLIMREHHKIEEHLKAFSHRNEHFGHSSRFRKSGYGHYRLCKVGQGRAKGGRYRGLLQSN